MAMQYLENLEVRSAQRAKMNANFLELDNGKASLAGANFVGPVSVPAGATGAQVAQVQEVLAAIETAKVKNQVLVTATGTSVDFTSIPDGVKRLTVQYLGLGTNDTSGKAIQLGTSAGVSSSNIYEYVNMLLPAGGAAAGSGALAATRFGDASNLAADRLYGIITIVRSGTGNIWTLSGQTQNLVNTVRTFWQSGVVVLPGQLDRIRVTSGSGTASFVAGTVGLSWEL